MQCEVAKGKRLRSQTNEVVVNVCDYLRKSAGINELMIKDLLNKPLMPQDRSDDSDQSDRSDEE